MSVLGEKRSYFASMPIQEFRAAYGDNGLGKPAEEKDAGVQLSQGEARVVESMEVASETFTSVEQVLEDNVTDAAIK